MTFYEVLQAVIGYVIMSASHGYMINDCHIKTGVLSKKRIKAATCDLVNGHGKEEDSQPGTELAAALEPWSTEWVKKKKNDENE